MSGCATLDRLEAIQLGGYSMKKKNTNAGISAFSAKLRHASFAT
jgi:hypothetical protein